MPAPTVWPMVLAVGITLLAAGLVTNWLLAAIGMVLNVLAVVRWLQELQPEVGEMAEARAGTQPRAIVPAADRVESLRPGIAGYRMQLPEKMHPYSAGVRGGIIGGLVMPIPALAYGIISGKGIWFPINLLAGMVFLRYGDMSDQELSQFSLRALVVGTFIHAIISVCMGLIYGVLLPTLPGRPILWGGIVMPLGWTGASYGLMGVINPVLAEHVEWRWFLLSQVVFGLVAGIVVVNSEKVYVTPLPGGPPG